MGEKLFVAFVWHMHQPLYLDLLTGKYHLPWVRLHATYSYFDMISILEEFPRIKVTFNLTPSLIRQLLDMSEAETIDDEYLNLSVKSARELTNDDKIFILRNFFSCNLDREIFPNKRYRELFDKRGADISREKIKTKIKDYSDTDFRDLQVLFNLAWCGFTLRGKNDLVKRLVRKGRSFTEKEKNSLLKVQMETVRSILPAYKRMQDAGRIEISTSPYYHPILPLLCRDQGQKSVVFSKDAARQIEKAISLYEKVFGRKPLGMWPPEGGVSADIVPLLASTGVKWIAADECVLKESFKGENSSREELSYKTFYLTDKKRKIDIIFRDAELSNRIGFNYSRLPEKKAVRDLMRRLKDISKKTSGKSSPIVSIILDGENPWPYYSEGGKSFLRELYKQFSRREKEMESVTVGNFLTANPPETKIKKLSAGSWINGNFDKWIVSRSKKLAWEYLKKAKLVLDAFDNPPEEALEELYIAEGSDWFWWYDDFGNELDYTFDELFRLHLSNVYRALDKPVPGYLNSPVQTVPIAKSISVIKHSRAGAPPVKVLIAASEVVPFAKTGGLADVSASLAKALSGLGCDARIIMPLYKCVLDGGFDLKKETPSIKNMPGFELYSTLSDGVKVYFLRNDESFAREGLYGTLRGDYPDNALRFGFFSSAVLRAAESVGFKPDIIHCNDWQTALIPFYLKFNFNEIIFLKGIKTLFTIHNMAYQGIFDKKFMTELNIPRSFFNMNQLEFYGKLNFMKAGILYSDRLNTVSERYAGEIMTPEYGAGLDGVVRAKKEKFYGIPNGADYSVWSPEKDSFIKTNFGSETIDKKAECKKDLLDYTRLNISPSAPVIGCVTRLTDGKGMDLFAGVIGKIIELGAGIVVLGRGSRHYNELFASLAKKFPGKMYMSGEFNDPLAHKIEAGADIFVMPSRYEPCGLNQIYSIKYGTIPVVRATGGLDDAIFDFDEEKEKANGFKFSSATKGAFFTAVKRAVDLYKTEPRKWKKLMLNAMKYDFSWDKSAKKYLTLYREIIK